MTAAARILVQDIPVRPAIPADAVPAEQLGVSRATTFRLFAELRPLGNAGAYPDGSKWFNSKHPKIAARLAEQAGVVDERMASATTRHARDAAGWCALIEAVEEGLRTKRLPNEGDVAAVERLLADLAPARIGFVPGYSTYMLRRKRYLESGRLRSSQLETRGRKPGGGKPVSPEFYARVAQLYLTPHQRGKRLCVEIATADAAREGWTPAPYRTAARWLKENWPPHKADLYRLGERAWKAIYSPAVVRDRGAMRGNEEWEVDNYQTDFWATQDGRQIRRWRTIITDAATGLRIAHASTETASTDSLFLAFARGVKRYGAPFRLHMDNGRDYHAASFGGKRGWLDKDRVESVLARLDVAPVWAEPYLARAKGGVEGAARTDHERYDKVQPGYCSGSTTKKPQGIDAWRREHGEELPTAEEDDRLYAEYVEALNDRPSDAIHMKGLSPRQRFERSRIAVRTRPDDELAILLMKLTKPVTGTKRGFPYKGIFFRDEGGRFFEYIGKKVRLRIDPAALVECLVCNLDGDVLFRAEQNIVRNAEEMRRGLAIRARARRAVKAAHDQIVAALDDTPTAILRAQAEGWRSASAKRAPSAPPPAPNMTPLVSDDTAAISRSANVIRREKMRAAVSRPGRGAAGQGLPRFSVNEIAGGGDPPRPAEPRGSMMSEFLTCDFDDERATESAAPSMLAERLYGDGTDAELEARAG